MDKASIARFAILIVAVINAVANLLGFHTINEEFVNDTVAVITGAYIIYMSWKNNYLSKKGLAQKDVLAKVNLD